MDIHFGKNIKLLRNKRSMTQSELGDVFGVKNTTVGGWENGNSFPEFKILVEMRVYFEVDLERLVFSDLSAISMPTAEEPTIKYYQSLNDAEVKGALEKLRLLEEELTRMRGEVGKMGVMDARMQLLERQLELVMGEMKGKKG